MRPILIDLDDTLLDDRAACRIAFASFMQAHAPSLNNLSDTDLLSRWKIITARHWQRFEKGELSFLEQRRLRVRDFLGTVLTDDQADEAFLPYLMAYESSWQLFPDVGEFLKLTADVPKIIVSNGDREQQLRKICATGLAAHFIDIITPEDCGYWKPNPEIFIAAARILNVKLSDCLVIGDDFFRDIVPAKRLGMKWFHVERSVPQSGLLQALV
jgi:putative hydrolase of the HAD superfamily